MKAVKFARRWWQEMRDDDRCQNFAAFYAMAFIFTLVCFYVSGVRPLWSVPVASLITVGLTCAFVEPVLLLVRTAKRAFDDLRCVGWDVERFEGEEE